MMTRTFALLALFAFVSPSWGLEQALFRAGAYAMDVTPKRFPISVNGGMSDRQLILANDPLHARCLVLDDGKTKLAIVIVDSCMLPRDLVEAAKADAAKRTKIPANNMLIAATHTHSAPTAGPAFQSDPDPDYVEYLINKIAEGIEKADKLLAPAKIGWASEKNAEQVFNRRWMREPGFIPADPFGRTTDRVQMNPGYQAKGLVKQAGPVDPEVFVLAVESLDGQPLALLANYSLHYVGGHPQISGDYFAAFADRIAFLLRETSANGPFVSMMSNGTSGDVNNVDYSGPAPKGRKPGEQITLVANSVAQTAKKAYDTIKFQNNITLAAVVKDIELGVRKPSAEDLAYAKSKLDEQKDAKDLKGTAAIYARESMLLAKYPDKVTAKIQALRIGDLGIAAIPCEVFTEIGLDIKKQSPLKKTFTIELANGYNGYLPTPDQHQLGGYETWRARSSYLEVDASTKITATVLDLLKQVGK